MNILNEFQWIITNALLDLTVTVTTNIAIGKQLDECIIVAYEGSSSEPTVDLTGLIYNTAPTLQLITKSRSKLNAEALSWALYSVLSYQTNLGENQQFVEIVPKGTPIDLGIDERLCYRFSIQFKTKRSMGK